MPESLPAESDSVHKFPATEYAAAQPIAAVKKSHRRHKGTGISVFDRAAWKWIRAVIGVSNRRRDASLLDVASMAESQCLRNSSPPSLFLAIDLQGDVFRCPPPVVLVFRYVLGDRKITDMCFLILACLFIILALKVHKKRCESSYC